MTIKEMLDMNVGRIETEFADDPALGNNDPEGAGWFFKIEVKDASELHGLMDEGTYRDWVKTL